jgi:two-component system, NarL family, sensor kinase
MENEPKRQPMHALSESCRRFDPGMLGQGVVADTHSGQVAAPSSGMRPPQCGGVTWPDNPPGTSGALDMATDQGKAQRSQLELLSEIVEEISGELALEPLLAHIVERACNLIGADDGVIGLYVPERDVIRTAASHRIPDEELLEELPRGKGLTGRVLELGQPVRCYYSDLPVASRNAPAGMHVIGMPIRARDRLIGVFGIGTHYPRTLDAHAQELLEIFARHAAVAIENARRYSEETRRASRFAMLARVAAIGAAGPDLDTLLQNTADAIHDMLDYPNVDIPLLDPDDPDTLIIRIRGGEYKRLIRRVDRLPVSSGIMGAAVRERRVQLVNDIASDPRYVRPPGVQPPLAELAIPILYGDQVLGVLNVEGNCVFDELDCSSLEIVAENLGLAIVNARLFERATEAAVLEERQRLARDLHDSVTQILSSMSLITQSLADAWRLDADEGERRVKRLGELSRLAFSEMRGLLHELSPRTSGNRAAGTPVRRPTFPHRLRRMISAMVPATVELHLNVGDFHPQAQAHEDALLRVCQEAVSNAVRHAAPSCIRIETVLSTSGIRLSITDDGRGIQEATGQGMGMANMRERLSELGGRLRVLPAEPGTQILAYLPRFDRSTK